jgi:hypothetical protein
MKFFNHPIYDKLQGAFRRELETVVERNRPAHVLAYLAGTGWEVSADSRNDAVQVWVRRREVDGERQVYASVGVPLMMDYVDYGQVMEDVLNTIAFVDGWALSVSLEVPEMLRGGSDA